MFVVSKSRRSSASALWSEDAKLQESLKQDISVNVSFLIFHDIIKSLLVINVWCISYLEFKDEPSVVLILLSDVSIMVRSRLCDLR